MPDQNVVNEVMRLKSQNLSNDEIAQRLLYQGYTNAQVFEAISQADVSPAAENPAPTYYQEQAPSFQNPNLQPLQDHLDTSKMSEIAESIIEEKWSDLIDHVNKIIEWKSSVELKVATMDDQMKGMRAEFDTLQKAIMGRISDSDTVMRDVSTDIKALEQVFKKILPGFVENVNELSRITSSLRKK